MEQKVIQESFMPKFWTEIQSEISNGWRVIHISEIRHAKHDSFGSFYALLEKTLSCTQNKGI